MRFNYPEMKVIHQWVANRKELWYEEIVDMILYTSKYADKGELLLQGISTFWSTVCNLELYNTSTK